MEIRRGDIFYADLSPVIGSEQGGVRPVLVVQNDVGNRYSPTVIVGAITSRLTKAKLPTHIEVASGSFGLTKDSVILLEQLRTLDKRRLKARLGALDTRTMDLVDRAMLISLGFICQRFPSLVFIRSYNGSICSRPCRTIRKKAQQSAFCLENRTMTLKDDMRD